MRTSEIGGDTGESPNYNEQFPPQRRREMLDNASLDRSGRPVVYYRYMRHDIFKKLITQGSITALDHFEDPDEAFDPRELAAALWSLQPDVEDSPSRMDEDNLNVAIRSLDRSNASLARALGELAAAGNFTPRSVHPLMLEQVDHRDLMRMHAGSLYLRFSPYLSLSVGCVIVDAVFPEYVYAEFVIPDAEVEPNPEAFKGEMEVMATHLQADWVTRVYTSTAQLRYEITTNPQTPVGKYYGTVEADRTPPIDLWRWYEPIEDYLPVSLLS